MNIRDEVNKLISIWACSNSGYPTHLYAGKQQVKEIIQHFDKLFMFEIVQDQDGRIVDITKESFLGLEIVRVNRESYLSVGVVYD